MRPRLYTDIHDIPLVGGHLCLDFVNTTGNRSGDQPRERFATYPDLLMFELRTGLITRNEFQELQRDADRHPQKATRVLKELIEFRELLYRLLRSATAKKAPPGADFERFNRILARSLADRTLSWVDGTPRWASPAAALNQDFLVSRLAIECSDLLTSGTLDRLRKCGECDWLFLDQSKNRSRRWCKKACGDRVKARRYYARQVAQA
ncbi:MAG: ABATE domain-containing protein [Xanthomonadales bacterium]|nr:ABATE domain-containing protein [Xanthomonadales bacterium]